MAAVVTDVISLVVMMVDDDDESKLSQTCYCALVAFRDENYTHLLHLVVSMFVQRFRFTF